MADAIHVGDLFRGQSNRSRLAAEMRKQSIRNGVLLFFGQLAGFGNRLFQ